MFLVAWAAQTAWLGWHFGPEAADVARRLAAGRVGEAVRLEDPFYRWVLELAQVIPPGASYVFLDRYEAGKEIEARYHLYPRRHVLGLPHLPPSYLFYDLRRHQAGFLVVHAAGEPLSPEVRAAVGAPAFAPLDLPGPGRVFRVAADRLAGDFYD
jgi:hypothetical protein